MLLFADEHWTSVCVCEAYGFETTNKKTNSEETMKCLCAFAPLTENWENLNCDAILLHSLFMVVAVVSVLLSAAIDDDGNSNGGWTHCYHFYSVSEMNAFTCVPVPVLWIYLAFVSCPIRFAVSIWLRRLGAGDIRFPFRQQKKKNTMRYAMKTRKMMMMNAFFLFSIGFLFPFDCFFNKIWIIYESYKENCVRINGIVCVCVYFLVGLCASSHPLRSEWTFLNVCLRLRPGLRVSIWMGFWIVRDDTSEHVQRWSGIPTKLQPKIDTITDTRETARERGWERKKICRMWYGWWNT